MKLTAGRMQLEIDLAGLVAAVALLVGVILWQRGFNELLSALADRLRQNVDQEHASDETVTRSLQR